MNSSRRRPEQDGNPQRTAESHAWEGAPIYQALLNEWKASGRQPPEAEEPTASTSAEATSARRPRAFTTVPDTTQTPRPASGPEGAAPQRPAGRRTVPDPRRPA